MFWDKLLFLFLSSERHKLSNCYFLALTLKSQVRNFGFYKKLMFFCTLKPLPSNGVQNNIHYYRQFSPKMQKNLKKLF